MQERSPEIPEPVKEPDQNVEGELLRSSLSIQHPQVQPGGAVNQPRAGSRRRSFTGDLPTAAGDSPPLRTGRTRRASLGADVDVGLAAMRRWQAEQKANAALVIQRCYRGRTNRKQVTMWRGAITKLRESFIDKAAIDAGATANPMYSDAALAARDALRHHPSVVDALEEAWVACKQATGRRGISVLSREDYVTMSRKIYLAVKLLEHEGDGERHVGTGELTAVQHCACCA